MAAITLAATVYFSYVGYSYYNLPLEDRFYHPQYDWFKASGPYGHGLGILGTLLMVIGVFLYITAKKWGYLERVIRLKYLLEFHIFLCTLGPIMILFHTTFKFGGIVSVAFWSMVMVVLSGVVGRYIYLQIPRTISGRELSLREIETNREEELHSIAQKVSAELLEKAKSYDSSVGGLKGWFAGRAHLAKMKRLLKSEGLSSKSVSSTLRSLKTEMQLHRRIRRLSTMQKLFKYWHVAHRPFAVIMLIIVTVHVVVTVGLGYTWIF
ncbi:MAG: hypothetical protein HWE14_08515 [Flavobacteriia bacterium]|nr:hypothetical protein [Flavobacteriia bacterium]